MKTVYTFVILLISAFAVLAGGIEDKIPAIDESIHQSTNVNDLDKVVKKLNNLKAEYSESWLIDYYTAYALIRKFELTQDVAIQLNTFSKLNTIFDLCEEKYPDNSELYVLKANYLIKKSRITNSDIDKFGQQAIIEAFQTAKELDDKNPRAYLVSSIYYLRAGKKDLSIKNADTALKLFKAQTEDQKNVYPNWGTGLAESLVKKLKY